jgi:tetratricopeptide (TPR) repeat protein
VTPGLTMGENAIIHAMQDSKHEPPQPRNVGITDSSAYADAVAHHRAGCLDLAEVGYRSVPANDPRYADALQLLGVIAQQRGDYARAVDLIGRAIALRPDNADFHSNLAEAHRNLGQLLPAEQSCREALRIQPQHREARLNLGRVYLAAARWHDAEQVFQTAIQLDPNDTRAYFYLGECQREMGNIGESIKSFEQAIACDPRHARAYFQLGTQLLLQGDAASAERRLRQALELSPRLTAAIVNLGACLLDLGRAKEAAAVFEHALRLAPNDPLVGANIGHALAQYGSWAAANQQFQRVLQSHPNDVRSLVGLADVAMQQDRADDARHLYERALQLDPSLEPAQQGFANALLEIGDVDRAVSSLREAIRSHPDRPELHNQLGTILATAGELEASIAAHREALRLNPNSVLALAGIASTLRGKLAPADLLLLEAAVNRPAAQRDLASLHFGLAHVYDGRGDYKRAAEHLFRANALQKQQRESRNQAHDSVLQQANVDGLIRLYTSSFFARVSGFGDPSELPVFVVGMPRSGTTLVEQILASHPQVHGAGERHFAHESMLKLPEVLSVADLSQVTPDLITEHAIRHCARWHLEQLQRLSGGKSKRVVDKMPENYQNLGWLATTLPKARFIHCRRDKRDVALSCWMTNFSQIRWSNDLVHIAHRLLAYERLMAHWRAVLPVAMLEIDYEQLVADQEGQSRKLIDWIGLEWDPACLEFHKTERLVRTASVTQVRQPIYSHSVQRWKHYQAALEPLLRLLEEEERKPA